MTINSSFFSERVVPLGSGKNNTLNKASSASRIPSGLPYQATSRVLPNPIIYSNDGNIDTHTLEYLMALASAGSINFVGAVADAGGPNNDFTPYLPVSKRQCELWGFKWEHGKRQFDEIIDKARRSGMVNLPKAVAGPCNALPRPTPSLQVADIRRIDPIGTPGGHLILAEALKAKPGAPLIVIVGGPFTAVADAYLLAQVDPHLNADSIFRNVIVAGLTGARAENTTLGYNSLLDGLAVFIVLQKTQYVQFAHSRKKNVFSPETRKQWMYENAPGEKMCPNVRPRTIRPVDSKTGRPLAIPESELLRFMVNKDQANVALPCDQDVDGPAAISLMRKDVFQPQDLKRKSFAGWEEVNLDRQLGVPGGTLGVSYVPLLKDDASGMIRVVTSVDRQVATDEWWFAMSNAAAYSGLVVQQAPFTSSASSIAHRIQAENYDWGGMGYAFRELDATAWDLYRVDGSNRNMCYEPGKSNFYLIDIKPGEWWEYTINVPKSGRYNFTARVSTEYSSGALHIEYGDDNSNIDPGERVFVFETGFDNTESIKCPRGGEQRAWISVDIGSLVLDAGEETIRIVSKGEGFSLDSMEVRQQSSSDQSHDLVLLPGIRAKAVSNRLVSR
jgi:hypothetical protein